MPVVPNIVLQLDHHRLCDGFSSMSPDIQNLVVTFLVSNNPSVVEFLLLQYERLRIEDNLFLIRRRHQVTCCERETGLGRLLKTNSLHSVEQSDRGSATELEIAVGDDPG